MRRAKETLTVRETAAKLGFTLKYILDLVYSGRLKADKVSGRWKIPAAEVEARLKKRESR